MRMEVLCLSVLMTQWSRMRTPFKNFSRVERSATSGSPIGINGVVVCIFDHPSIQTCGHRTPVLVIGGGPGLNLDCGKVCLYTLKLTTFSDLGGISLHCHV